MNIHVEGVGLIGAMLLNRLAAEGLDFTWYDTGSDRTAWQASTGMIYPDADMDRFIYNSVCWFATPQAHRAPYVFSHKNPPHGAKYRYEDRGPLRVAKVAAVVADVGSFVTSARRRFVGLRAVQPPPGSTVVQCRPSAENTSAFGWGWSAPVTFGLPECVEDLSSPAFYGKMHRFDMTYAYPSTRGVWLAGSDKIKQKVPSSRPDTLDRFRKWKGQAEDLFGLIDIELEGPIIEGWRPLPIKGFNAPRFIDGRWVMPAMGSNGVRHGWSVVNSLVELL